MLFSWIKSFPRNTKFYLIPFFVFFSFCFGYDFSTLMLSSTYIELYTIFFFFETIFWPATFYVLIGCF